MKDIQAFPSSDGMMNDGMTLLDWFAGQAMKSMISNNKVLLAAEATAEQINCEKESRNIDSTMFTEDIIAIDAYDYAEAMLRQKEYRDEE